MEDLQQRIRLGGEDEAGFVQTIDLVGPDGEAGLSQMSQPIFRLQGREG